MMQKITTSKIGICYKCGREIKQGWTGYYDDTEKHLYCKPCGEKIGEDSLDINAEKTGIKSDNETVVAIASERQVIIDALNTLQKKNHTEMMKELKALNALVMVISDFVFTRFG